MSSLRRQTGNRDANCDRCRQSLVRTRDILLRTCNICKDAIFGVGTCLKCNACNYYFHEICLQSKPTSQLQNSFYPAVNFSFSESQGRAGKRCVACYQLIQGCFYVGNGAIYMHPSCLVQFRASASNSTIKYHREQMEKLLKNYDLNGGRVDKRLELQCQMSLSPGEKCIFCKPKDRRFGWVYKYTYTVRESSPKYFECHIACLRAKLIQYCKNQIIYRDPGNTYDQRTYFLQLGRSGLEDYARGVAGFALPVAIAGLDLIISAFVGAPLVSLSLSFFLGLGGDQVESLLRRRPRGN